MRAFMLVIVMMFGLLATLAQAQTEPKCVPSLGTPVCAQVASPPTTAILAATLPDPIASTVNFDQWMGVIGDIFDSVDAKGFFRTVGAAVLGVAVFFLAIQLVLRGGLFEGFQYVFLWAFIAGAVFLAADPIGDLWKFAWHANYKYSTSAMGNIYAESAQQLTKLSQDLPMAIIKVKTITAAQTGQTSASVQVQQKEGTDNWLERLWLGIIAPLSGLIYAALSGFYTFAVLIGVLTIQFGKISFPLVAALLVLPGSTGLMALGTWARAMTVSVVAAFFLPLMYGFAAFITMLIPISHANAFITFVDALTSYMKNLSQTVQGTDFLTQSVATVVSGLANTWGIGDIMGSVTKFTGILVILPLAMVMGLVIGAQIIMKVSSMIAGLLGGIALDGGYENPVARAATALWGPVTGAAGAAVGGAASAVGGAVSSGASAVGGAVSSGAGAIRGAVGGAVRSAGTAGMLGHAAVRPAPPMNNTPATISSVSSASPATGPGGAQVNVGGRARPATINAATVSLRGDQMQSNAGKFIQDGYRGGVLRDRIRAQK